MKAELIQFLKEHFPSLTFSDAAVEQLLWRFESEDVTPEKAAMLNQEGRFAPQNWQFGQMKRTGASLNCIGLLKQGEAGYEAFVAAQSQDKVISKADYLKLCARIADKDSLYLDVLHVATIIQMITLSPRAKLNADQVLGKGNYTFDSVEFLADTFADIEKAKAIYPLVADLYERIDPSQHDRITDLLQSAFASNMHFRHMLYTECNENGFAHLYSNIVDKVFASKNDERFTFWADFWLFNCMGFRGQVDHRGAQYFDANTAQAVFALLEVFDQTFEGNISSPKGMLDAYLAERAAWLHLNNPGLNLEAAHQQTLAHIGAMMRLFTPEEGEMLLAGYMALNEDVRQPLMEVYHDVKNGERAPTYVPAVFANAIDVLTHAYKRLEGLDSDKLASFPALAKQAEGLRHNLAVIDSMTLFLPFYFRALQLYRAKVEAGEIKAGQPLSFKAAADLNGMKLLFPDSSIFRKVKDNSVRLDPELNANGELSIKVVEQALELLSISSISPAFERHRAQQGASSSSVVAGMTMPASTEDGQKQQKKATPM